MTKQCVDTPKDDMWCCSVERQKSGHKTIKGAGNMSQVARPKVMQLAFNNKRNLDLKDLPYMVIPYRCKHKKKVKNRNG
ncbi:hypothetical protein SERLA73DRAFT_137732 [Serpula lacrymans var. lacrymans S7.3]|uniref:Uncharacterized protein n=2 Tax=Serpula lacrymans var. lacrymans TaxID=341189 RepID=F8PX23_SERL3|nr:uncharacterized protein SERLADRAFT_390996 [Serpula lacrymans var. lacrymans S7.9]EGN99402.1 hypothetical protein SERLA73DRAFT_137732 [Serpula lacrymans var. lacrymans S7.3]EGO24966.1 hypothetical protein SERLADRAFT_390996 [Serpula lacrymans var. lacrymans S7.9]